MILLRFWIDFYCQLSIVFVFSFESIEICLDSSEIIDIQEWHDDVQLYNDTFMMKVL